MRRYETIFIVDPDLSAEERTPVFDRLNELIPKQGGFLVEQDEWGLKRLAYEIKKKPRGYYVRLDYCGTGAVVDEMERLFKIDDRVLKYMTIVMDKDVDTEKVKEEMTPVESTPETPDPIEPVQPGEPDADPDAPESPESDTADPDALDSPESNSIESDISSTESDEKE